jgi:hypothetical protein
MHPIGERGVCAAGISLHDTMMRAAFQDCGSDLRAPDVESAAECAANVQTGCVNKCPFHSFVSVGAGASVSLPEEADQTTEESLQADLIFLGREKFLHQIKKILQAVFAKMFVTGAKTQ